jgi:hypothetical protein
MNKKGSVSGLSGRLVRNPETMAGFRNRGRSEASCEGRSGIVSVDL